MLSDSVDLESGLDDRLVGFKVLNLVEKVINRADPTQLEDADVAFQVYGAEAYMRQLEAEEMYEMQPGDIGAADRLALAVADFERACAEGDRDQANRNFQEAGLKYRAALEIDEVPHSHVAYAYCQIGRCLMETRQYDRAEGAYMCYSQIAEHVSSPPPPPLVLILFPLHLTGTAARSPALFRPPLGSRRAMHLVTLTGGFLICAASR